MEVVVNAVDARRKPWLEVLNGAGKGRSLVDEVRETNGVGDCIADLCV